MSRVQEDVLVTMTDLRRQFHRVIRQVEHGTSFTVLRRGTPVARLVPVAMFRSGQPDLASKVEELLEGFGQR